MFSGRVLAINIDSHKGNKPAYKIDPLGGYEVVNFEFGKDTEVFRSCSLQWQNQYYVFGGYNKKRQVSMVNGNRLEQKATLDFEFKEGTCSILNQNILVLCFDWDEAKMCRQSNNPLGSFKKLPSSNYDHRRIRIASFGGENTNLL